MRNHHKSGNDEFGSIRASSQRTKTTGGFWTWVQRFLLISGLVLLAIYGAARIESILGSRAALEKFDRLEAANSSADTSDRSDAVTSEEMRHPEAFGPDFSLWSEQRVAAYHAKLTGQSSTPLGVLRISKIRLEVPILDGTDDLTLNHAVGRIEGTSRPGEPGNIGIAGHRDGFFRGLKDVRVGDAIELKTLRGTDTYVVDQIVIVRPEDVSVLRPRAAPSLTLVTCYPFYFIGGAPRRYIVKASLSQDAKSDSERLERFENLGQVALED